MAWSDAARQAALEARRAHAKAKVSVGQKTPKHPGGLQRSQVASDIRAIRSGKSSDFKTARSKRVVMEVARMMTNQRNANRKSNRELTNSYSPTFNQKPKGGYAKSDKSYWARMSRAK